MSMIHYDVDARVLVTTDQLMNGPHVVRIGEIDDKGMRQFRRKMQDALDAQQEIVPVLIDSDGGSTYAEMAILDEFDAARSAGLKIATIVSGRAQSAGADILAAGDKGMRFAAPMATVMVHDAGDNPPPGKIEDLRANYEEMRREHEILMSRFEDNCGKPRNYFRKLIHERHGHADWYMSAKEAKEHGIVDHIGLPELHVSVAVKIALSVPKRKTGRRA